MRVTERTSSFDRWLWDTCDKPSYCDLTRGEPEACSCTDKTGCTYLGGRRAEEGAMKVRFNPIPGDERVAVRAGAGAERDTLRGFLVRTGGQGPVWATADLAAWLEHDCGYRGHGFTSDTTMAEAMTEIERIAEMAPAPAPAADRSPWNVALTFRGLPDKATWDELWDLLHSKAETAQIRITRPEQ